MTTYAEALGISLPYLSDIERGNRKAPDRVVRFYEEAAGDREPAP